jgi:hypothetical protein
MEIFSHVPRLAPTVITRVFVRLSISPQQLGVCQVNHVPPTLGLYQTLEDGRCRSITSTEMNFLFSAIPPRWGGLGKLLTME